jgi:carbonic anhydrase
MSLFESDKAACKDQDQSPINLTQTTSLPCKRLCNWSVDDRSVRSATVSKPNTSVVSLSNFSETITASFNESKYTCSRIDLYNMSQHSIENGYGDLELVASMTSPGKMAIKMSVIINSSARNSKSPSIDFLNAFVPHAGDGNVAVTFDGTWSLQKILPSQLSYFVYEGRDFINCEEQCKWIIYKNPVDIDSSTYARLVGSTVPDRMRKPLQQLSVNPQDHERHVYFSDAVDANPAYAADKKDGKVYMRCRRAELGPGGTRNTTAGKESFDNPSEDDVEPVAEDTQVRSSGLLRSVSSEDVAARAMAAENNGQKIYEWFLSIGGFYGLVLTAWVIVLTILMFTALREIPIKIYSMLMYVPAFFYALLFQRSA